MGIMSQNPSFYIDKKIFSMCKLYELPNACGQNDFNALLYMTYNAVKYPLILKEVKKYGVFFFRWCASQR